MNQIARHDYQTLRRQRARIDELEEEVRQLRQSVAAEKRGFSTTVPERGRAAWGLTVYESKIVFRLAERPTIAADSLVTAVFGECRHWHKNSIQVALCKARKKLAVDGITIPIGKSGFYQLDSADRQKIRSVFEGVIG